jgi:putative two-component system response regulator
MTIDTSKHQILIVDDEFPIRELIAQIVRLEGYSCVTAAGVDEALDLLGKDKFSLVISDINMPGRSGLDLLDNIVQKHHDLAVLMATAVDDRNVAIKTLEMGAYGYIIKPFERNELVINVANAITRLQLEIDNQRYSEELEELVDERTKRLKKAQLEIRSSREETIYRLAKAAEFRDNETAQHTMRMGHFCGTLAKNLGLKPEVVERIHLASPLHDVGKIGISDTILLKPGKLTREEFEAIKEHSVIGYRILADSKAELLKLGAIIAYTHHEKIDGSGYPRSLKGDDIPLEGRIAAICDVFDALTSDRVYKAAMTSDEAMEIIMAGRGTHFDSNLLDCFIECLPEILTLKLKFADG